MAFSMFSGLGKPSFARSVHLKQRSSILAALLINCYGILRSFFKAIGVDGSKVTNENQRFADKLKGYFELAIEEIDKAGRAEKNRCFHNAVSHYMKARFILAEGASTRAPSSISLSEKRKLYIYHQKISKLQGHVSERLQVLSARTGGTTTNKVITSRPQRAKVLPKTTNAVSDVQQRPTFTRSSSLVNNRAEKPTTSKSSQDAGGVDAKLVELINTVIVDSSPSVKWDDVAGLEQAKLALNEMVIYPSKNRALFTGLRRPARGLLLFGPPGNGKTMLAKAVASECNATFFNVSASTLTSKWVGEGEKLVRTLFMVARLNQPSVIFMDEIDSMLSAREANEHDASRRLKSEFLVQLDGVTSNSNDLVIVIGATNRPQELDDAVLRRLVKRIYIPLPDVNARNLFLRKTLTGEFSLPNQDMKRLSRKTEGYSGSDLQALCEEAAMMPIREFGPNISDVEPDQVRPLRYEDFRMALSVIRPSLDRYRWEELERWNQQFGSMPNQLYSNSPRRQIEISLGNISSFFQIGMLILTCLYLIYK